MPATGFAEGNMQALLENIAIKEGFIKPTYSIENGSKPGQNFVGRIFRAVITENQDGIEKSLSLIFKASSTNKERHDMMCGDVIFHIEKNMYEVVLPTLNNFLKKHGVADHPIFPGTPKCFAAELQDVITKDKPHVIVLEDKKVQGFETYTIRAGLTAEQCRLSLKRIALLHATSMALYELEPETAEQLEKLINFEFTGEAFVKCVEDLKKGFTNGLELLEEPYTPGNPTYEKLRYMLDNFTQEFKGIREDRPKDLVVIGHTDFTANNILFKVNKDGSTDDACMIDFQMAACVSIGVDLTTLLLFCTKKEVRDEHFENLLQFYFDEVTNTLRGFGCDSEKIFPWELLQKHLRESMKTGVLYCIVGLPVMMAESSEVKSDIHSESSSEFFSETAKITDLEGKKQLKQRLHDAISDAVRWGFT